MKNINQKHTMENRTRNNQVIFFKNQEEFAKALREGTGSIDEVGSADEQVAEE